MYEKFFNLRIKPFELLPNPDFLFYSKSHKKTLTYVDYGIREKVGFILVTGEVGCGKTTLIRNLIKGSNGNVVLSKVFNTKVTSEQLLSMVNEDFGLNVTGKDKIMFIRDLNDFLIEQYSKNIQPILIIDEAQNLSPELLEEVRMLSNLETDTSKLLQIILVGQPELIKTLALPELRQLRQRINIRCHLFPLTREEAEEYILHRLEIAGNREAVRFEEGTTNAIYDYSRGIPRLINIICDFLMLSAFVEETRVLSMELVKDVIGDLEIENRYWESETREDNLLKLEPTSLPPEAEQNTLMLKISREKFMQIIKETGNRINRLSEEVAVCHISVKEREEIRKRCAASEEAVNDLMTYTHAEISRLSSELENVGRESEILRGSIDKLQCEITAQQRSKRGLLRRMFS